MRLAVAAAHQRLSWHLQRANVWHPAHAAPAWPGQLTALSSPACSCTVWHVGVHGMITRRISGHPSEQRVCLMALCYA